MAKHPIVDIEALQLTSEQQAAFNQAASLVTQPIATGTISPKSQEIDTFDFQGGVFQTQPDASAIKISGTGPATLPPQTKPVASLSSVQGEDIATRDAKTLQTFEGTIAGTQGVQFATEDEIDELGEGGVVSRDNQQFRINPAGQLVALQGAGPIQTTGSPALDRSVVEANQVISQGGLSEADQASLAQIQTAQDDISAAISEARTASDQNDFLSMNAAIKRAEERRRGLEAQLSTFFTQIAPLRQQLFQAQTPSEKAQALSQQLIDLRTGAQQFELQLSQDKFAEFEGQTARFAQRRGKSFDIKAGFAKQETSIREQNLLLSIGLETKAQEMRALNIEQQIKFIQGDFALQQDIQDKLNESEDDLLDRASALRDESRETLSTILGSLEGVDPTALSVEARAQLQTLATQAGIPFELIKDGLQVQFDKRVFDESIKKRTRATAEVRERRLAEDKRDDTPSTLQEREIKSVAGFSAAFVAGATYEGQPVIGLDGFITPAVWKAAIADAPAEGLSREKFIEEFGYLLNTDRKVKDDYGLTRKEWKLVTG